MAGSAQQIPTSSNVGWAPTAQQQQPQPLTEELRGMVEQLQKHIQQLEGRLAAKSVNVRPPKLFNGNRSKL